MVNKNNIISIHKTLRNWISEITKIKSKMHNNQRVIFQKIIMNKIKNQN